MLFGSTCFVNANNGEHNHKKNAAFLLYGLHNGVIMWGEGECWGFSAPRKIF